MADAAVLRETLRCRPVSATVVPYLWAQVEPLLVPAIRDPLYTPMDLYLDLAGARATLWLVERGTEIRAAVVTRVLEYASGNALRVQLCGGSGMWSWVHLLREVEDHAREVGCAMMTIEGRKGWGRVLPDYTERAVIYEKELP